MKRPKLGIFISFEGTEGSGKSTLIRLLAHHLEHLGYPVVKTREPGGSDLAEKIRHILLTEPMTPQTEIFLFEAARHHHWEKVVKPALSQGARKPSIRRAPLGREPDRVPALRGVREPGGRRRAQADRPLPALA